MEWDKIWAVNKKVQTDMYIYLYTVNILLVCLLLDLIGFLPFYMDLICPCELG